MNWLRRLKVKGFRVLGDVDVELRPLNVVIGGNGSGKTSLLDVLSLLAGSAEGRLSDRISQMGGFDAVLSYSSAKLFLDVTTQDAMRYQISLVPARRGVYAIEEEHLFSETVARPMDYFGDSTTRRGKLESALSQPVDVDPIVTIRRRLAAQAYYRVFTAGRKAAIREPQQLHPRLLPGLEGQFLASALYNMRESHPDRYEAVEDTLRAAFPSFDRLKWPSVAAGHVALEWWDKRWNKPFDAKQLSEGTLRFLWLVALLQSPRLPRTTLIDEPEVSLHPELLSLLADLLREAALRSQIIVATQSDRLVRFLEPKEVLVADLDEKGFATFKWADDKEFNIDKWLEDYTLDEIWSMGRIGGRS